VSHLLGMGYPFAAGKSINHKMKRLLRTFEVRNERARRLQERDFLLLLFFFVCHLLFFGFFGFFHLLIYFVFFIHLSSLPPATNPPNFSFRSFILVQQITKLFLCFFLLLFFFQIFLNFISPFPSLLLFFSFSFSFSSFYSRTFPPKQTIHSSTEEQKAKKAKRVCSFLEKSNFDLLRKTKATQSC
jgi:hypothetical protein